MKIEKPEMPDFSKMSLDEKLVVQCAIREATDHKKCQLLLCGNCAYFNVQNYKEWQSQQKNNLVKWPLRNKDYFFVLPRASVNKMPNLWKLTFLKLLGKLHEKTNQDEYKFRVSVTKRGKYVRVPDEFKKY